MEKRTQLALLIIVGLFLLGIGLYLLLTPYLASRQAAQPPSLPSSAQPFSLGGGGAKPTTPPTRTATSTPAANPSDTTQVTIENRSRTVVERVGSGTSANGFLGYQDVLLYLTASGRAAMLNEQQSMQKAHPANGPLYAITTRGIASHLSRGRIGDAQVVVTVEALQNQNGTTVGKQILVTFVKQPDNSYLIDSMAWSDVQI